VRGDGALGRRAPEQVDLDGDALLRGDDRGPAPERCCQPLECRRELGTVGGTDVGDESRTVRVWGGGHAGGQAPAAASRGISATTAIW